MKTRLLTSLLLSALTWLVPAFAQTTEQTERIATSFVLAQGRLATAAELAEWSAAGSASLPDLLARHRDLLKKTPAAQRTVVERASADAFGRAPTAAELSTGTSTALIYTELMQQHVAWLAQHPDDYRQVIERAYRSVVQRAAYDLEFNYWKPRATLPYLLLVGSIEHWGQRNAPGLMVTSGTPSVTVNSRFLATLRLSRAVANEARAVIGLPVWSDVARLQNPDNHVVAVGAAGVASVGGIHFLAVGGGVFSGS